MRRRFLPRRTVFLTALPLVLVLSLQAGPAAARDTLVFAAASTVAALDAALADYASDAATTVRVSYASSGALARQIDNGAPADLYLSANRDWIDWAEKRNLLAPGTRTVLFHNRIVLIEPTPDARMITPVYRTIGAHLAFMKGWLAIGDPDHVPAGTYARAALKSLGLWEQLKFRTTRTRDVRAALLLVERREASLGIVYQTDAFQNDKVRVLGTFPPNTYPPITYGLAIVRNRDNAETRRLYAFLQSRKAKWVFSRFGFLAR